MTVLHNYVSDADSEPQETLAKIANQEVINVLTHIVMFKSLCLSVTSVSYNTQRSAARTWRQGCSKRSRQKGDIMIHKACHTL